MQIYKLHHLVKTSDLNHHGTLFAGRTAEWFVEAGFVAAAKLTKPENIVCLNIHGMKFTRPVPSGAILCLESRIVLAGRSSLVAHVQAIFKDDIVLSGFITFVHVNLKGVPIPHNLTVEAQTEEEKEIQNIAKKLNQ